MLLDITESHDEKIHEMKNKQMSGLDCTDFTCYF